MKLRLTEKNYQRLAYKGYAIGLFASALGVLGEGYFWYFGLLSAVDSAVWLDIAGMLLICLSMLTRVIFENRRVGKRIHKYTGLYTHRNGRLLLIAFTGLYLLLAVLDWNRAKELGRSYMVVMTCCILMRDDE